MLRHGGPYYWCMDRTCSVCTQTTDDGAGKCRFCGGEYVARNAVEDAAGCDLEEPMELVKSPRKSKVRDDS